MSGLAPGLHVFKQRCIDDVDGRKTPRHDEEKMDNIAVTHEPVRKTLDL